jgi:hypothetical protein
MSFNGTGSYVLPTPAYPAVSGEIIYADRYNEVLEDLAAALSNCITIDGQSVPTANITLGTFKITQLRATVSPRPTV